MSDTGKRFLGWSVESIVGNIVWSLLCALGLFYFNERTGCVYIVLDSMRGHELELAGWTIAFTLFGALVGLMVRHRIAIRQLDDKDSAAKERISSELADIEGFKQVDSLDALIEKARELSSLNDQLAAEIAARDAEIAELRQCPTPEETEAAQSAQSTLDEYDRARREARSAFRSLSVRDMEFIIGLNESGARTVIDPDPIIAVLGRRGIVRKALDSPLVIDLDPEWRARIDAFRDVFDDVYGKKKGFIDR